MSKRQVRYGSSKEITTNTTLLLNQKVNLVLRSGAVYFVQVDQVRPNAIEGKNMRGKAVAFSLEDIDELIFDIEVG